MENTITYTDRPNPAARKSGLMSPAGVVSLIKWYNDKSGVSQTVDEVVSSPTGDYIVNQQNLDVQIAGGATWSFGYVGSPLIGDIKFYANQSDPPFSINNSNGAVESGMVTGLNAEYINSLSSDDLQYTDAEARAAISTTVTGLAYDSELGIFSSANGYTGLISDNQVSSINNALQSIFGSDVTPAGDSTWNFGYVGSTLNADIEFNASSGTKPFNISSPDAGSTVMVNKLNAEYVGGLTASELQYTLEAATSTVLGGIKLFSNTSQSEPAESVSAIENRTYGIQLDTADKAVVNVPWQFYSLPVAEDTVLGGVKLYTDVQQNSAATVVQVPEQSRTYGIQLNSDNQMVVSVPWEGTSDHGTLSGLSDDDHSQYHNDARGDARYELKDAAITKSDEAETITQEWKFGGGGIELKTDDTINWGNGIGRLSWDTGKAWIYGQSGNELSLGANGANNHLYIDISGNVGVNTTPSYRLDVNGTFRATGASLLNTLTLNEIDVTSVATGDSILAADDGSGSTLLNITRETGNVIKFAPFTTGSFQFTKATVFDSTVTATNFIDASDKSLKKDIIKLNETNKINDVEIKSYVLKKDESERKQYGVIAQELQEVYPELVLTDEDGLLSVDYRSLSMITLQRVQEQENRIKELERKIDGLSNK